MKNKVKFVITTILFCCLSLAINAMDKKTMAKNQLPASSINGWVEKTKQNDIATMRHC